MADYIQIAKIFEDSVENIDYYETRASVQLKHEFLSILENERRQLLFLIGKPGCGKSVFLHRLPDVLHQNYEVIQFQTPFFEPVDFIKSLIKRVKEEVESYALEDMIEEAVKLFQEKNVVITIDEAQLLSKDMVELLRILADSKAFWFLLAMHEHDSQRILKEPQFSSRPHRVLHLTGLEKGECIEYISKELLKVEAFNLQQEMSKLGNYLYKLSGGNFRDLKKILNRMFLLMDCALKNNLKKFEKPSRCLVTMAAIDGGILAV